MTYKEKYEDLDRSQLPEKAIVIIDTMKKDSKGFTDTEALEVIGPKFDQVIAKLKSSGYDAAFKSLQKKEPEPKTPVAQAKKIVKQAIKQPKTTAKTAKPTVGAFKKGAVGELAKKIRKEGEAWPTALKRAGQMIKEQKSGVQKKATAQYKKLNSLLTKMPALGKGTDVERDAPRKAKPVGKRTAKSGKTYYEYRSNRTDVRQGKGYPYLKLGAMLAKGGEIEKIYDNVQMFEEISDKEINYIVKKMNEAKGVKNFDKELKKIVDWVWDNEPRLSKEQDAKGIKFLKNLAFMANGKSRSNTPFGSREEYTLKNFAYFKLRGFHDVSRYGQPEQYVPLYTVYDDEGYGFEYFYHAGKINVVGAKGMSVKNKKTKIETDFFDSDKKVQDFLNLSRVQFMARYKETKERYQQMVNAITRNIEGVFMHGGQMGGAGQFNEGGDVGKKYVIVNLDTKNIYIKSTNMDFIKLKLAELREIYPNDRLKISVEHNEGEGGHMANGGMMRTKYDVIYNSYDKETGDMIAEYESVYVMASSVLEAKNKAMTMLEEGSRDEDFLIVRVRSMMAKGGMMADGGMTSIQGIIISFPYDRDREDAYRIKRIIEDHVGMLYADYGDEIYVRVMDDDRGEVNIYNLQQIAKEVRSLNLGVKVESYAQGGMMAKGGHMATGGLTNIKGNAPVMKYPEIKSEITIVE
jgi:hypothetical protein